MTPNPHEAARALGMSRAGDNSPGKAFLPATMAARTIVATGERGGEPILRMRQAAPDGRNFVHAGSLCAN